MKNKIVKAFLAAARAAACGAAGYAAGRKRKTRLESGQETSGGSAQVGDDDVGGCGRLTEAKVRQCLLNLFWMYDYDEFEPYGDCSGDNTDDTDLRDCAAGYYAPALYRYMKKNMGPVFKMDGDDGTGHEPFNMTDRLLYVPACRICSEPEEMIFDRFDLSVEKEVWILENATAVSVYRMDFEKDGWRLVYRFLDRHIRMPDDMEVPFEELEAGLARIMEEMEGDKGPAVT